MKCTYDGGCTSTTGRGSGGGGTSGSIYSCDGGGGPPSLPPRFSCAYCRLRTLLGGGGWGRRPRTLLGGSGWGRRLRTLLGGMNTRFSELVYLEKKGKGSYTR